MDESWHTGGAIAKQYTWDDLVEKNASAGVVAHALGIFRKQCFQDRGVSWVLLNSIASLKKDNVRRRDVDKQLIDLVRIRGPQLYP